ncbi:MAG: hypothetical protein QOG08_1617, partial [Chloroflexota bacterium]|nr:hypothetical protein [Chloroflexota bacterium]
MAVDGVQTTVHRVHRDMGAACPAPSVDLRGEVANVAPAEDHPVR